MLSLRWLKGFLTQKLSERCSWLSQKQLNSCKVCTKKKTSLRAGDQRQKQGSLWRVTEVQKTTRLRWTRVNTRKNPASRSNELETFSDKVGGDVLGAFEVVGVKVLFHFQLRCQMMWDDVRWCQMMWDDWQTEWLTPQMDVKPSWLINRWTTVLESVWISK